MSDDLADTGNPLRAAPLSGIRRLTALESVRARIAMAVELDLLAPGEQLPGVAAVASALNVSQITVRRALSSLCEDGILEGRRGRNGGTFVARSPATGVVGGVDAYAADTAAVRGLIDQRALLESAAARLAASRATAAQVDGLDALVRRMETADTWAEFRELDTRFHHGVAAASGVEHAEEQLADVLARLHAYFLPYRMDTLHDSNAEHAEVVGALRRRAPEDAFDATFRHVMALRRTMFIGLVP